MLDERQPARAHAENQKRALLDAAEAAVADAQARAVRPPRRTDTKVLRAIVVLAGLGITLIGVYLLATRPAWLITPPPPTPPAEVQEASLRLTLVREANRIWEFRTRKGHLPAALSETGSRVDGISYERKGDSLFVLRAPFGTGTVAFVSTDAVAAFLGGSLKVIAVRSRP